MRLIIIILAGLISAACAPTETSRASLTGSTTIEDKAPDLADGQCETLQATTTLDWTVSNGGAGTIQGQWPTKVERCRESGVMFLKASNLSYGGYVAMDLNHSWPRTLDSTHRIQWCPSNRQTVADPTCKIGTAF